MRTAEEVSSEVGASAACDLLSVSRATLYHRRAARKRVSDADQPVAKEQPRALSQQDQGTILETLNSERFVDQAPRQVYAALLDEGVYHCSVRTMYRILAAADQVRERRDQLRHPAYSAPQLLATAPNQVWSWDITKLLGPVKWTYFYLFVVLDIFSRYVVGWMLAQRESGLLASRLIEDTCAKQMIQPDQLTLHSDRGPAMKSGLLAGLLADLGVTKTHSRPHVSNDNPFSESQFRTLKYRPQFPNRFESFDHAHSLCQELFHWYNTEHHHSALGLHTPENVHYGRAELINEARQHVLLDAYQSHPERFVKGPPRSPALPAAVWINPPPISANNSQSETEAALH